MTIAPDKQRTWEVCLDAVVSTFPNAFGKTPKDCCLSDLLDAIRSGRYATPVESIRATYRRVLQETGDLRKAKGAIAAQKRTLLSFCMSGTAVSRTQLGEHSGLLQIDLDGLGELLPAVRVKVRQDPHLAFGFVSPSGDGLKLGLRIDGVRHEKSFAPVQDYFKNRYDLQIDKAVKDRLRLCFVSHDPDLWTNPDAVVFTPESCPAEPLPLQQKNTPKKTNSSASESTSCILRSTSYITQAGVLGRIKARAEAMALLEAKHPGLERLYESLIERRYDAIAGGRNHFVVEANRNRCGVSTFPKPTAS